MDWQVLLAYMRDGWIKPDTIHAWHFKLVAQKFDCAQPRTTLDRPKIDECLCGALGALGGYAETRGDHRRDLCGADGLP